MRVQQWVAVERGASQIVGIPKSVPYVSIMYQPSLGRNFTACLPWTELPRCDWIRWPRTDVDIQCTDICTDIVGDDIENLNKSWNSQIFFPAVDLQRYKRISPPVGLMQLETVFRVIIGSSMGGQLESLPIIRCRKWVLQTYDITLKKNNARKVVV